MSRERHLKHDFVRDIPAEPEQGKLYISIQYATAVHRCCCGCGNKVVTPISPADWTLIFDGEHVSLDPSIGNWSFPCKSHYWITANRVKWARVWSREEIEYARAEERTAMRHFFATKDVRRQPRRKKISTIPNPEAVDE